MTREMIKKMYIDWMTGADDEIKQSDIFIECFKLKMTDEEIDKIIEEAEEEIAGALS